ncbi:6-phosphofructo-2-kinase 1 [[Candida] jaroonii]|uniref:6-phosphofructo-2-kinase 1 n=1 Tax=[Candida] jaroonii TaxID=467808 RepID=A0ACA9Y6F6_9ASCO|nr:6-phosphofructo-2-kinase 1 [[Candida] jaroonii]
MSSVSSDSPSDSPNIKSFDNKKVSFNHLVSLPTSNESSDIEDDYESQAHTINSNTELNRSISNNSENNLFGNVGKNGMENSVRRKNSANSLKKYGLRKLPSYPISRSKSIDSTNSNDSNSNLPEFNKRPLTDTPVVSSFASPDYNSEDIEKEDEKKISRMKNISHLNLAELPHTRSMSPQDLDPKEVDPKMKEVDPKEVDPKQVGPKQIDPKELDSKMKDLKVSKEESVPSQQPQPPTVITPQPNEKHDTETEPLRKTVSEINQAEFNEEFQIPLHLQEKFRKSASLEKLKTLLTTKPTHKKAYTLNIPGQTSSKISPDGRIANVDVGSKLVIVMVGLPARGKSYITNKLTRYLNWLQHDCRVFNVGNTRRLDKENNNGPEDRPLPDSNTPNNETSSPKSPHSPNHNADFFSPDNYTYTALREKWAMDTLDQLLDYVLDGSGSVGIFDATNSTKSRRTRVLKRIQQRSNGELKVLFLESVCTDPMIIESNIRLKLSGPDYREMDPDLALKDFVGRLHNYEKAYETIDEQEEKLPGFQYVKMIDVGKKVVSYNVQGFLASQTIYFLLNFNLCERQIWITRHGESTDNLSGRIGGDAPLTKRGKKFAKTLSKFMNFQRQEFRKKQLNEFSNRLELKYLKKRQQKSPDESLDQVIDEDDPENQIPTEPNFYVWTSMLMRAIETGKYFDDSIYSVKQMRMLNELGGGKFEGLTYEQISTKYPKEYESRIQNKLTYRYPGVGGESYLDVLTRLRPLITEIERTTDHLLIVSHRVVLRILLAYFLNLDRSAIGELDVPLHTLYCLESHPYGTDYRMYEYDEALDWFVKVEPEHQKNVKEVGVVFKERKYSVVPTAPPSHNSAPPNRLSVRQSLRRSLSQGFSRTEEEDESLSSKKLNDLNKLRKP